MSFVQMLNLSAVVQCKYTDEIEFVIVVTAQNAHISSLIQTKNIFGSELEYPVDDRRSNKD